MSTTAEVEATIEEPVEATPVPDAGAHTSIQRLHRFSSWVHIGPGAEDCEDRETGACGNPLHFHAWCRLPNPFQHRVIQEKANAAKARRIRLLRDEDSDGHVILEMELDSESREEDASEKFMEELTGFKWWKDYDQALGDMLEIQDAKDVHTWEHIAEDQARFRVLGAMDEDDRPSDEYRELEAHLTRYNEAFQKRLEEVVAPRRQALEALPTGELLALVREQRIGNAGHEEFMHWFSTYEWLACTLRARDGDPVFPSLEVMVTAPPEVVAVLTETFNDLERSAREGNS